MVIFEIRSCLNKKVRLTRTQWDHTVFRNRELRGQKEKIIQTIQHPEIVLYSQTDDNYQYYRYYSNNPVCGKYLLAIVKHLNDEGFVITAFFLRKIKEKGKVKVYER